MGACIFILNYELHQKPALDSQQPAFSLLASCRYLANTGWGGAPGIWLMTSLTLGERGRTSIQTNCFFLISGDILVGCLKFVLQKSGTLTRISLVVPSSARGGGWCSGAVLALYRRVCGCHGHSCFLIVALSVHLSGRMCLGSAGALAATWQTARAPHTALLYHRHRCYTQIKNHVHTHIQY